MSNDFEDLEAVATRFPQGQGMSQLITRSVESTEYSLYIHGSIGSANNFMEHFAVLKQAGPNDVINLYLNTPGGNLATAVELIDHINECQAQIVCTIGMDCASAGVPIALACDAWKVGAFSTMMVHSFSYGVFGHATGVENHSTFNSSLNAMFVQQTYKDFLTKKEIKNVIKGVDLFIGPKSLADRLSALAQARDDEDEVYNLEQEICNEKPKKSKSKKNKRKDKSCKPPL